MTIWRVRVYHGDQPDTGREKVRQTQKKKKSASGSVKVWQHESRRSGERSKKAESSPPPTPPPLLFALVPFLAHPNWKSALLSNFAFASRTG